MFIGLDGAKLFGLCQRFWAILGIFDKEPCREICWKSFISPVSPIVEQDCGCHNRLNGLNLQRNVRMRARECEKTLSLSKMTLYLIDRNSIIRTTSLY